MANEASTGLAITGTSLLSAGVLQWFLEVYEYPVMSNDQAAGAIMLLAGVLHGVVSLVGPVAKALSERFTKFVQLKEVPHA